MSMPRMTRDGQLWCGLGARCKFEFEEPSNFYQFGSFFQVCSFSFLKLVISDPKPFSCTAQAIWLQLLDLLCHGLWCVQGTPGFPSFAPKKGWFFQGLEGLERGYCHLP